MHFRRAKLKSNSDLQISTGHFLADYGLSFWQGGKNEISDQLCHFFASNAQKQTVEVGINRGEKKAHRGFLSFNETILGHF